jgi:exodeoxyribonuclease III
MNPLSIATWNINSVRLRQGLVADYLTACSPDVLCLQEIKCRSGEFPFGAFSELGYVHHHIVGQKGWHGVAILSRLPLQPLDDPEFCRRGEARVAAALVGDVEIHNLYVPAGGDVADPDENDKFAHKLDFLGRMNKFYAAGDHNRPLLIAGDFNVAPGEFDVWSHKQLLDVVSHTPVETEALDSILSRGGFVDLVRQAIVVPEKPFTWWSYRSTDWTKNDRGRRLDHIWATKPLAHRLVGIDILKEARAWTKPSDHVPLIARFSA